MASAVRFDIISIGTLARNRLWNETQAVRTPHATTTLIRGQRRNILVDPALPAAALAARLFERTGLRPEQIDTVFLTSFQPANRFGLTLFTEAKLLIHETEQAFARHRLGQLLEEAPENDLDHKALSSDLKLLDTFQNAPDQLAEQVDLFPLFGYTPGNCGLLLALPTQTVIVTGGAVASQDHFLAGQVLPECHDINQARQSLQEIYEIADLIVPGHDNVFVNPRAIGL